MDRLLSYYVITSPANWATGKKRKKKQTNKNKLFYGQADLSSRVGRSGVLFVCVFKFLVAKITQITLKTRKFRKISLIFKNFQVIFLDIGQKPTDFTRFWKN